MTLSTSEWILLATYILQYYTHQSASIPRGLKCDTQKTWMVLVYMTWYDIPPPNTKNSVKCYVPGWESVLLNEWCTIMGLVLKNPSLEERLLLLVDGLGPFFGELEVEAGFSLDFPTSVRLSGTELLRRRGNEAVAGERKENFPHTKLWESLGKKTWLLTWSFTA